MKTTATIDGYEIKKIVRYGWNGHFYEWSNPTQDQLDKLEAKYGIEQVDTKNGVCWLQ